MNIDVVKMQLQHKAKIDELEATLEDEEAAHQDTLRLLEREQSIKADLLVAAKAAAFELGTLYPRLRPPFSESAAACAKAIRTAIAKAEAPLTEQP